MTITLFITILTIGASATTLLTEAIKKCCENAHFNYSANLIALINAVFVGCGGTAIYYCFTDIPWTVNNIICLFLMGVAVWLSSTLEYDKVLQLLAQISEMDK